MTLPIPQVIFEQLAIPAVGQVFVGYRLLAGEPLSRETFLGIQDERTLEGLAHQLAQFLRELHHVPVETAIVHQLSLSDTYDEWNTLYMRIREKCFPFMRRDAQESTTRTFETFLGDPAHFARTPVLKHGDFGTTNILFDQHGQVISGILDFSEAGLGDPAYDFAGALLEALFGIENHDQEAFERGIEQYL